MGLLHPFELLDGLLLDNTLPDGEEKKGPEEILRLANFILSSDAYQALLENAVETLDKAPVRLIIAEKCGRQAHQVQGSKPNQIYVCSSWRYCSCRAFLEQQKKSPEGPVLCKHLLAIRLAPWLDKVTSHMVPDKEFSKYVGLKA